MDPQLSPQGASRRGLMTSGVGVAAVAAAAPLADAARAGPAAKDPASQGSGFVAAKDGAQIFYKDWGSGQPIVFSHGWPLTSDDWDAQMMFFADQGFRVVAHDRRGHGRSSQTWGGNDMDTYADDLRAVVGALDLRNAIHIGHSTGGGEVTRYLARHGTDRASKGVLIGAIPPVMVKKATNPEGTPLEVFDGYRTALLADRAQLYIDIPTGPFYGFNRPGAKVSQGLINKWWRQGMMGSVKAGYDCIKVFSETDFTDDLKKIDIPVLVMHGEDDQVVPYKDAALKSAKLLSKGLLKTYPGLPHGMATTHADLINADILAFIRRA
ncbi:alpha/beta fold hydrolase [Phenylobacterium koreense]|uniref:Non-heme chloroperoxidase n=1 Tax=Phenylobacterium koreense TaxID=266125 RepID=A0ABV2EPN1_9CAUL